MPPDEYTERRAGVKEIHDKLDAIAKAQAETFLLLNHPEVGMFGTVKRMKATVYGNGKVGLKTQVFVLWLSACGLWAVFVVYLAASMSK